MRFIVNIYSHEEMFRVGYANFMFRRDVEEFVKLLKQLAKYSFVVIAENVVVSVDDENINWRLVYEEEIPE